MGYDLCLFEDEDVDEELICPICRGVLGTYDCVFLLYPVI